jgi:hypothetical protein
MIWKLLDWLCARWLRRYEGDLPVSKTVQTHKTSPVSTCRRCGEFLGHGHECAVQPSPAFITNEQPAPLNMTTGTRVDTVHTPLADALSKPIVLPDVPKQTVTVKGEFTQATKDYGVSVEADYDIGQKGGWSTGATAQWWKNQGTKAIGWLKWEGK